MVKKQFILALNSAELIKYAFYRDYHLPASLAHINLTQERILLTIKNSLNVTMVSISRAIGLEKGPFSQCIDKLASLGYVRRIRSNSDRSTALCFVSGMVCLMSLSGSIIFAGISSELPLLWLKAMAANFCVAFPLQVLIARPLIGSIFRKLFPIGTIVDPA